MLLLKYLVTARSHTMKPVVEIFSAKVACKELHLGAIAWIALLKTAELQLVKLLSSNTADAQLEETSQLSYVLCIQDLSL